MNLEEKVLILVVMEGALAHKAGYKRAITAKLS